MQDFEEQQLDQEINRKEKVVIMEGKKEQVMIPLEKLEPSPYNTFMNEKVNKINKDTDVNFIADMVGSIKSVGLITPLSVVGPMDNGKYQILSGERRYRAIRKIAAEDNNLFKEVPCYIFGDRTMDVLLQQLAIETANLETRDINKDEHILNIIGILKEMDNGEKHNNVIKEMGKYMKISDRYKRMYRTIFETGTEQTKDLLNKKVLAVHEAATISGQAPEVQELAASLLEKNVPKKEVLSAIKAGNAKEREARKKIADSSDEIKKINQDENGVIKRTYDDYEDTISATTNDAGDMLDEVENNGIMDIEDDDEFIEAVNSGKYQKQELMDLIGNPDENLFQDAIGLTRKIKNEEEKTDKVTESINNWVRSMMKKTSYTEAELDVIENMRMLIEVVDTNRGE